MALLLVAASWWVWLRPNRPGPEPLAEARASYERGDFNRAAEAARERLRTSRDDPEAIRILARTYSRRGDFASARRLFGRLNRSTFQAEDLFLLGSMLRAEGRGDEARTAFEMAEAFDPRHPETASTLAELAFSEGDFEQAIGYADRLRDRNDWAAFAEVIDGRAHLGLLDPGGAVASLERALRLDPELRRGPLSPDEARMTLARALLRESRGEQSRERLDSLDRPDAEAQWLESRSALQRGDLEAAIAALARARDQGLAEDPMRIEPASYVGADRCAECHPTIARDQRSSQHARTFHAAPDLGLLPLPEGPIRDPQDPAVIHRFRLEGDAIHFETEAVGERFRAEVRLVMGSGTRGLTPVAITPDGRMVELRLSHYGPEVGWTRTTGHAPEPGSPEGYLGIALTDRERRACLNCHTTHFRQAETRTGPTIGDGAIGCERCHGPGGNHLAAIALGFPDPAIARPKQASADQVVALCGDCHRPPGTGPLPDSSHPLAVRFQATTFVRSACYLGSPGSAKFDCVSCHDPHCNAERDPAHYEAVCLSCHSGEQGQTAGLDHPPPPIDPARQVSCAVEARRGCLDCHMPRRPSLMEHTRFTDHHIRAPDDPTLQPSSSRSPD